MARIGSWLRALWSWLRARWTGFKACRVFGPEFWVTAANVATVVAALAGVGIIALTYHYVRDNHTMVKLLVQEHQKAYRPYLDVDGENVKLGTEMLPGGDKAALFNVTHKIRNAGSVPLTYRRVEVGFEGNLPSSEEPVQITLQPGATVGYRMRGAISRLTDDQIHGRAPLVGRFKLEYWTAGAEDTKFYGVIKFQIFLTPDLQNIPASAHTFLERDFD